MPGTSRLLALLAAGLLSAPGLCAQPPDAAERCGTSTERRANPGPASSDSEHRDLYIQGLRAVDYGRWREAEVFFVLAIEANPQAGGLVRPYGTWLEPYVPHFYLGLARLELGNYGDALEAWNEAERQAVIFYPRSRRKCRAMMNGREELRRRVARDLETLTEDIERLRLELGALAVSAPLVMRGGAEEAAMTLEQARVELEVVDGAIDQLDRRPIEELSYEDRNERDRLSTRKRELLVLEERLLQQAFQTRQVLLLQEEERREAEALVAEARDLAALLDDGACHPEAAELGERLTRRVPDDGRVGETIVMPYLLRARSALQCDEPRLASLLLAVERRRGLREGRDEIGDLQQRIEAELRAQAALETYERALEAMDPAGCAAEAVLLFEETTQLWWRPDKPGEAPEWAPHRRLARAFLRCGLLEEAAEELAIAHDSEEDPAVDAELDTALTVALEDAEAGGRAMMLAIAAASDGVRSSGCQSQALAIFEMLLRFRPAEVASSALDVARGALECGRWESAEVALASARERPEIDLEEFARLNARLERGLADTSARRRLEDAAAAYVRATAWLETGECRSEVTSLLDRSEGLMRELADGESLPKLAGDAEFEPLLARARAAANCGNVEDVASVLRSFAGETRPKSPAIESLQAWLEEVPFRDLYEESHALLIAVHDYEHWPKLPGVVADRRAIEAALAQQGFEVTLLEDPDHRSFDRRVRQFIGKHGGNPKSRLLIYYAGHGHTETKGREPVGWLVPTDTPDPEAERALALSHMVGMDQFAGYADRIESAHSLFILDSCFGGSVFRATHTDAGLTGEKASAEQLLREQVRMFLTAGNETQQVSDLSMFRRFLVEALEGQADVEPDGVVLGQELGEYLKRHVTSTTPLWGKSRRSGNGDILFRSRRRGHGGTEQETVRRLELELELWDSVLESDQPEAYAGYLALYPEGTMAELARRRAVES